MSSSYLPPAEGGFMHVVEKGECLSLIAWNYGFTDWRTVYEHPANAAFRARRPNPNVIYPGDELFIPLIEGKEHDKGSDNRHKFVVKREKWKFRIFMIDESGRPIANKPFKLEAPGMQPVMGTTNGEGLIETEVPAEARHGTLTFLGDRYEVSFGMLDPVSRVTGVQARLNNLGYHAGPVDGIVGPKTRKAVYLFQAYYPDKLKATGEIDDATRKLLLEIHDADTRLTPAEEDMSEKPAPPDPADAPPPPAASIPEYPAEGEQDWTVYTC
jgi:N-acetylmuramoyl-L-alanine amidase